MKSISFPVMFLGAVLLSLALSMFIDAGPVYILGALALVYLFGLMVVGVFRTTKPHVDDPAENSASDRLHPPTPSSE